MNRTLEWQSARGVQSQQQPWNGPGPATGCVRLGGSAADAEGGTHV